MRVQKKICMVICSIFVVSSLQLAGKEEVKEAKKILANIPEGQYLGLMLKLQKFAKKVDINEVIAAKDKFVPSTQVIPRYGYVYDDIWASLDLVNDSDSPKQIFFELKSPFEYVDGYLVVKDSVKEQSSAGMYKTLQEETSGVHHAYPVLSFMVPPGESTVYFSENAVAPSYPIIAYDKEGIQAVKKANIIAVFTFVGACMMIFAFLLALVLFVDSVLAALLILSFVSFIMFSGFVTGMFRVVSEFFNLGSFYVFLHREWMLSLSLYILFLGSFAILFSGKQHFFANRKFKIITGAGLFGPIALMVTSFIDPISAMNNFAGFSNILLGMCLYVSYKKFRGGSPEEIFQFIGWVIFAICAILQIGYFLGLSDNTLLAFWGNNFGFPIIIALMGVSILDRNRRNLETKVRERTKELSEKNRDIKSMLENMNIGMFSIIKNCVIHPQYSAQLEKIFERKDLANTKAMDLVFGHSSVSDNDKDQIRAAIEAIVGEGFLSYEMNSHLLTREIEVDVGENKHKILSIDWLPIEAEDITDKLLVSIKDITADRASELERARYRFEMTVINEIVQLGFENFVNAYESFNTIVLEIEESLNSMKENEQAPIDVFYRKLHTIKGNSRVLGLTGISNTTHHSEEYLQKVRNKKLEFIKSDFVVNLEDVKKIIASYRNIWQTKLGKLHMQGGNVDADFGKKVGELITNFKRSNGKFALTLEDIVSEFVRSQTKNLEDILDVICKRIKKECVVLGKDEPKISFVGDIAYFDRKIHSSLQNVFTHCFGNSIDHGLETSEERAKIGKVGHGNISLHCEFKENFLDITYKDDGRGINVVKLMQKFAAGKVLSDKEAAELIFKSGVSTKEEVSDISGRGVGMDAVRSELKELGGGIDLVLLAEKNSEGFCPFQFVIRIPMKFVSATCQIF